MTGLPDENGGPGPSNTPDGFLVALAEAIPQLLWTAGPDGWIEFVNRRWVAYTGRPAEESLGDGWQAFVHPDDLPRYLAKWEEGLAKLQTVEIECRLRDAAGVYRWFLTRGVPVRDDSGDVVRWVGTSTDVDERRRAQEVDARLAAIVASSDDAIIGKTLEGVVTSWNAAAEQLYGYTAAEMIGQPIDRIIPDDRMDEERSILERLGRGERIRHVETVRVARDGRRIDVSLAISPILDGAGRVTGISKIARDISARKRAMAELEAAKEAAEEANHAKDRFLALLSHELRTPLTPALATLSYLEHRSDLGGPLREDLASVRRQVELESRLIDNLLDLTRVSRKELGLQFETVDVHGPLSAAVELCCDAIGAKGLTVTNSVRAGETWVRGDPARLQQLFWHLVQNAARFSREGGTIGLRIGGSASGRVSIEIADTGMGIEPADLQRIFQAFEQAEQGPVRSHGGLGLGLTIARSLAELHGGAVRVRSNGPGGGSVFSVELESVAPPVRGAARRQVASPAKPSSPPPRDRPLRILLVEDNLETLRAITRLLRVAGFEVETATGVGSALQVAAEKTFDLIVSDIGLPDGSGLEIMRQLKQRSGLRGIAFSGYGAESDIRASIDAGFAHHLTKPVKIDQLIGLIVGVAS